MVTKLKAVAGICGERKAVVVRTQLEGKTDGPQTCWGICSQTGGSESLACPFTLEDLKSPS